MVVQHNLQAMNANRMLNVTTGAQAKSTEKLSSGYRINRAADDAAGLSISEKMRKQIRGLDQASSNAQDGVSAVQTAEGALTEVHDMLQRMNELAVQASNGTNSESDRQSIQDEIDQLTTEIDRVAETTKFNETYLLKGGDNQKTINLNAHDAGLKGKLVDNGDGTAVFTLDTLNAGDKVTIGGKEYTIGSTETEIKNLMDSTATIKMDGVTFGISSDGSLTDGTNKLYISTADGVASTAKATFDSTKGVGQFTSKVSFKDSTTPTAADVANNAATSDNLKALVTGGKTVTINGSEYTAMVDADNDKIDDNNPTIITKDKAYALAAAELLKANQIGDTAGNATATSNGDGSFAITVGKAQVAEALSFNLHVGSDADMTNKINVNIETMNSSYLGIKNLNVTDNSGIAATYAIDAIADAVSKVSAQRSALGAVQNRLEHTINNLDNVVENTTSAESAIRDTDMAEEMVNYSKNNILAQAGQSMLAQANQSTQGVLSLLG